MLPKITITQIAPQTQYQSNQSNQNAFVQQNSNIFISTQTKPYNPLPAISNLIFPQNIAAQPLLFPPKSQNKGIVIPQNVQIIHVSNAEQNESSNTGKVTISIPRDTQPTTESTKSSQQKPKRIVIIKDDISDEDSTTSEESSDVLEYKTWRKSSKQKK